MITVSADDITKASGGSRDSGKSFVRTLFFRHEDNDTKVDCINHPAMPNWNDCHPVYTAFFVSDIGEVQDHSDTEWYIEITYSNKVDTETQSEEVAPWDLPPQNFRISTFDKSIAMTRYWDLDLKAWRDFRNSAGVKMTAEKTVTVCQISFTKNYRHRIGNTPIENLKYMYNANTEKVCNYTIPPLCGKLLPFTGELHSVTDSSTGKVKYEYYSVDFTIQIIQPSGEEGNVNWAFEALDVGTLAKDEKGNLGAIFKYRKAENKASKDSAPVEFGSLEDVISWRDKWPKEDWGSFPFEEFTEPLPLNRGMIYREALTGEVPYNRITGIESRPVSWRKFDLPERR